MWKSDYSHSCPYPILSFSFFPPRFILDFVKPILNSNPDLPCTCSLAYLDLVSIVCMLTTVILIINKMLNNLRPRTDPCTVLLGESFWQDHDPMLTAFQEHS